MRSIKQAVTSLALLLLLTSAYANAASQQDAHLIGDYNFVLEIDGAVLGRFAKVDGLGAEIEVLEFREGGEGGTIRKIPGRTTYGDIVLKRGYTANNDLWNWIQEIIDGDFVTKNGSIRIISKRGRATVANFAILNAWPSKYRLGTGKAHGKRIAIEELTLTVERIELR